VLQRPGRLEMVEQPEPDPPGAGAALVATRRVGLCGTDYKAFAGDQNFFAYPRILGHELAVEVIAVGRDVRGVRRGDLCAVLPYLSCGHCFACRRGRSNCCERLEVLGVTVDGGLRERFVLPASALWRRAGLGLDELALVETLGVGFHAVARADPRRDDLTLVVGAGPIGLAIGHALLARGARVAMTDLSEQRLAAAAALLPVETVPAGDGLAERVRNAGRGQLPAIVFEATGSRGSMESSLSVVAFSGSLVLVGHTTGGLMFDNPTLHRREITVIASRNAGPDDWGPLLDLIDSGAVDAAAWVSGRTTLEHAPHRLAEWGASPSSILKGMVEVPS
jgi:threonine dehydrogenase-like Zn-dependent dehydrogenase